MYRYEYIFRWEASSLPGCRQQDHYNQHLEWCRQQQCDSITVSSFEGTTQLNASAIGTIQGWEEVIDFLTEIEEVEEDA